MLPPPPPHTHTHTHTHTQTYTHTHKHTHLHTRARARAHTRTHTYNPPLLPTCAKSVMSSLREMIPTTALSSTTGRWRMPMPGRNGTERNNPAQHTHAKAEFVHAGGYASPHTHTTMLASPTSPASMHAHACTRVRVAHMHLPPPPPPPPPTHLPRKSVKHRVMGHSGMTKMAAWHDQNTQQQNKQTNRKRERERQTDTHTHTQRERERKREREREGGGERETDTQ